MSSHEPDGTNEAFEKALAESKSARYVLRLFIAGNTPRSMAAIESIRQICETKLRGRYSLEVIDIHQQPDLARGEQIIATPTLIKTLPPPLRRVIGDLSSKERILVSLNLEQAAPKDETEGGDLGEQ